MRFDVTKIAPKIKVQTFLLGIMILFCSFRAG